MANVVQCIDDSHIHHTRLTNRIVAWRTQLFIPNQSEVSPVTKYTVCRIYLLDHNVLDLLLPDGSLNH